MTSKQFTTLLIRLSLGFIYLSAGLSKLAPGDLGNLIGPVDLSVLMDSLIIDFIMKGTAVVQVIGGALILTQRFSLAGLLLLLPLSLGILILTIFTGFGGTVFINVFLLCIHLLALFTYPQFRQVLNKRSLKPLLHFSDAHLFPGIILPAFSFLLLISIIPLSFIGGYFLNVLVTMALLLITAYILHHKKKFIIDYIILSLFFIISFITINGMILNSLIPKFFYSVFILIPIGIGLFFIRLLFGYYIERKKNWN